MQQYWALARKNSKPRPPPTPRIGKEEEGVVEEEGAQGEEGEERKRKNCTVHGEDGRMTGRSSLVGRRTRVLPRVPRGDRLDAEDAILFRGRQNINIGTIAANRLAVQRPRDLDR